MLQAMKSDNQPGSEARPASANLPSISSLTRRSFLHTLGLGSAALALTPTARSQDKVIQGFEQAPTDPNDAKAWKPVSDRKIRVGLVGYGVCQFGAAFGFQNHPNVEVVAVSDLDPDRCAELAKVARCAKTYPSLEELVKDDHIEAVFVATDAPSHVRHCLEVLKRGKHVASAVPAAFGSIEDAHKLFDAVKATGFDGIWRSELLSPKYWVTLLESTKPMSSIRSRVMTVSICGRSKSEVLVLNALAALVDT